MSERITAGFIGCIVLLRHPRSTFFASTSFTSSHHCHTTEAPLCVIALNLLPFQVCLHLSNEATCCCFQSLTSRELTAQSHFWGFLWAASGGACYCSAPPSPGTCIHWDTEVWAHSLTPLGLGKRREERESDTEKEQRGRED